MATFTLDTSGFVTWNKPDCNGLDTSYTAAWPDLDPFTQGFMQASAEHLAFMSPTGVWPQITFASYAPEAVELILKDCAAYRPERFPEKIRRHYGAHFWGDRQRGGYAAFPPLTVSLGDDGKVHLEVAA